MKEKLIVALDVPNASEALTAVEEMRDHAGAFKIGLQLFIAEGPSFVRKLAESGVRIFLDVKYHDIPNTVAKASVEAARLGVWMFNMHASGGSEMLRTAASEVREFCARESRPAPKMIAVTVLTSSDEDTLSEIGVSGNMEQSVLRLASLAAKCGLDGVVASAMEVPVIRASKALSALELVTPGIRPAGATIGDQKRVMTPGQAIASGSDYIVVGRPIMAAKDRAAAAASILREMVLPPTDARD